MTDRHAGYLVVLEDDVRCDSAHAKNILKALSMVKGVLYVKPVISDPGIAIAQYRERMALQDKLNEFIKTLSP